MLIHCVSHVASMICLTTRRQLILGVIQGPAPRLNCAPHSFFQVAVEDCRAAFRACEPASVGGGDEQLYYRSLTLHSSPPRQQHFGSCALQGIMTSESSRMHRNCTRNGLGRSCVSARFGTCRFSPVPSGRPAGLLNDTLHLRCGLAC